VKQSLALPFRLLRDEPRLVARFAIGSLGRSALTAGTILLIRDFLGGALATRSAHATALSTSASEAPDPMQTKPLTPAASARATTASRSSLPSGPRKSLASRWQWLSTRRTRYQS